MFAQASTAISDGPGFGAAEWVAILTGITLVLGAITTLVVQIVKLRTENRDQHDQNARANAERFDELIGDVKQIGGDVRAVDAKVDAVTDELHRHEAVHHRGRRRW
jgi:hypothetical protein